MGWYKFEVSYSGDKDRLMGKNPYWPDTPYAKLEPITRDGIAVVEVESDSEIDAALTAEQMVAAVGLEPTDLLLVDWDDSRTASWAEEPLRTYDVPTDRAAEWVVDYGGVEALARNEEEYLSELWEMGELAGFGPIKTEGFVDAIQLDIEDTGPYIWDGNHRVAVAWMYHLPVVPVQAVSEEAERLLQNSGFPWR